MTEVVGANARKIRLDAGRTLEEMAKAARSFGLPWSSGRVGDFEAGRTAASLPTLIAVVAALSDVIGRTISLMDLFAGEEVVHVNDSLELSEPQLRDLLHKGTSFEPREGFRSSREMRRNVLKDSLFQADKSAWPKALREVENGLLTDVWVEFTESDVRVCKAIGVDGMWCSAAMASLWGRTFNAERNLRAGSDANSQKRGQISRRLKAELKEALRSGDD